MCQIPRSSGFTLIEMLAVILLITTIIGFGVPAIYSSEKKQAMDSVMHKLYDLHQRVQKMQMMARSRGYCTDSNKDGYVIELVSGTGSYTDLNGNGQNFGASPPKPFARVCVNGDQAVGTPISGGAGTSARGPAYPTQLTNKKNLRNLIIEQLGANDPTYCSTAGYYFLDLSADGFIDSNVTTINTSNPNGWWYGPLNGRIKKDALIDENKPIEVIFSGGKYKDAAGATKYKYVKNLKIFALGFYDVK